MRGRMQLKRVKLTSSVASLIPSGQTRRLEASQRLVFILDTVPGSYELVPEV